MDFIRVAYKENQDGTREFYPSLQAIESQDLVIRGGQFAAIWNEDTNLYSRNQSHMPVIIDRAFERMVAPTLRDGDVVKKVVNFNNQLFNKVLSLIRSLGDMGPDLDQKIIFADQEPSKADAATFKMPYSLADAPTPAWDEICEVLYDPEERLKFEYAMGSILTGASVNQVQKFYVFFGPPGKGKSTIMNVMEDVFVGHTATFSAAELGKSDSAFSLEPFMHNPLVAIDQDADLSRIDTNQNINKLTAHDRIQINVKGRNLFKIQPRSTLIAGTNDPVKIKDRRSGLFRRLVDIKPTGDTIEETRYNYLTEAVKYEVGAIAMKCIRVFDEHGVTYLSSYRSTEMMYRTNDIFNFVEDRRMILNKGITLKQAFKLYSEWCEETETRNVHKQFQFRDLLMDYFKEFHPEIMIDGVRYRSYFDGLRELEKFSWKGLVPKPGTDWLELDSDSSIFDELMADQPAQEASRSGTPKRAWSENTTTLKDLDTSKEHFVKIPERHIVVDFDLKNENGEKSLAKCLEEAAKWPATYAEVSRSGEGLHLHYDTDLDVTRLDPRHGESDGIEIKTLLGNASLRRRLISCNGIPVAPLNSGLKLKEEKVLKPKTMQTEKGLRELIGRALLKDIHPYTKSNMDFIKMVTDEAYNNGIVYDIHDMWDDIMGFAMASSNQKDICIEIALSLHLASEEGIEAAEDEGEKPIADFDIEVFPNLVVIGWMYDQDDAEVVKMINPTPDEVETLLQLRLIGYNNRGYDNHILWALTLGWPVEEIYALSRRIIAEGDRRALFGAAYDLAYADLYDIIVEKHSVKWWQVKLGLPHMELDLPWDQPVPENRVMDVLEYLENDVRSQRAIRKHRQADFNARLILAELSGLAVCNTNRQHTERLIFGKLGPNDTPDLIYTDLREQFPGYEFNQFAPGKEKSTYKGYKVSEGGWVKSKPGMYYNVGVLDVASMHPTSIVELNMFGKDTKNFEKLLRARLAIKKGAYDEAADLLGSQVEPYLGDQTQAKALSDALKIVINSVYGLTASTFPHKFRDDKNVDNIVAKRGALFMVDLVEFVESEGYEVVHVKTDSIKIPNITPEIIDKVRIFGEKYGYTFEYDPSTDLYERFVLVNDAVYVALTDSGWTATGAQFLHPVVFKTLFTHDDLEAKDFVEVKQVAKGYMYLRTEDTAVDTFIGRFGAFVPVLGGRLLLRIDGDKESAVTGTKGHLWETEKIATENMMDVDFTYFQNLIDAGRKTIEKFGDYAAFTSL